MTWSGSVITYTNVDYQISKFTITESNLHVPVVTLSTQDNAKLLPHLEWGFKRTISWNKYLLKPELLAPFSNLNHFTEQSFQGANRIFVLAFEDDRQRTSNIRYYLPNVEIKDYNVLWLQNFFDQPIKNNKLTKENTKKMATEQRDDYTTGCLLD